MATWYGKVDDLLKVNAEIASLERWRNELIKDIMETLSPVKVGDVVSVENDGCRNLKRGRSMKVVKVVYRGLVEDQKWVFIEAIGDILKADGTPGQYRGSHYYRVQYDEK